jgi:hypothetical protein
VLIVIGKTSRSFVAAARRGDALHLVHAQGHRRHAEPDRPDRAGPFGVLQTLADGIKLFFKEQSSPTRRPAVFRSRRTCRSARVPRVLHRARSAARVDRRPRDYLQLADLPIGVLCPAGDVGLGSTA